MAKKHRSRVLTPYLIGPSAKALGGRVATVLIPTCTMPMEHALLYGEQAAARGATPLLLRQVNQPMPTMPLWDRLSDAGGFLITVDMPNGGGATQEDLVANVQAVIAEATLTDDWGEPPKLSKSKPRPAPSSVPDLTPEEQTEFLKALYGRTLHPDGG